MSYLAYENSPYYIPYPTYQWTNALFAYIRSNLWSILPKTYATDVEFDIIEAALIDFPKSPPGTTVGGW